jgi:thioredoxin 1
MELQFLEDTTYERKLSENIDSPVLLYFMAPWCGPCKSQEAILLALLKKYTPQIQVFCINVDTNPLAVLKYEITTIPTHKLLLQGIIKHTFLGLTQMEVFESTLKQYLK